MNKRLFILLYIFLFAIPAFAGDGADYEVISSELKVYASPDFNSRVINVYPHGMRFYNLVPTPSSSMSSQKDWIYFYFEGEEGGYVRFNNLYPIEEIKNKTWYPPQMAIVKDIDEARQEAINAQREVEENPPSWHNYSKYQLECVPAIKALMVILFIHILLTLFYLRDNIISKEVERWSIILYSLLVPVLYLAYFAWFDHPFWFIEKGVLVAILGIVATLLLYVFGIFLGLFTHGSIIYIFSKKTSRFGFGMKIVALVSAVLYILLVYNMSTQLFDTGHNVIGWLFVASAVYGLIV